MALMEIRCIRECDDSLPAISHGDADLMLMVWLRFVYSMNAITGTVMVPLVTPAAKLTVPLVFV